MGEKLVLIGTVKVGRVGEGKIVELIEGNVSIG